MTSATRELHIKKALEELRQRPGVPDTARIPFRGKSQVFEVIELPLEVPILNPRSFRIAPLLNDHAKQSVVEGDPESAEAQEVVADLVRRSHRHAEGLKGSLRVDGQDQPGVITRSGKLINGNSRCVMLRDLVREGAIPASTTLRVAVLPGDVDNREELDLESILQQQKDFKDEYNLVSRLMMLQTLSDNGMSDQAIAASQREKYAATITRLREVLVLMNRARALPQPTLPLSTFVRDEDQKENWLGLLKEVREIESIHGRARADEHIRGWLIAYFSGHEAVHQLRKAKGDWVTRDLLPHLAEAGRDGELLSKTINATPAPTTQPTDGTSVPDGVDLLDVGEAPTIPVSDSVAQRVLDIVVQASQDPDREFEVADGVTLSGQEVRRVLHGSVAEGLNDAAQRKKDTNRLVRPQTSAETAAGALKSLIEALDDVLDDAEFSPRLDDLRSTLDLVQSRLDEANSLIAEAAPVASAIDDEEEL
ncbi:MAG: hypothetical protein QM622_01125 [Microbacterium sp.]